MKKIMGKTFCYYRLCYNVFSIITLVPVLYFANTLKSEAFFIWNGIWLILKYAMITIGVVLIAAGARGYSFSQFSGLRQIKSGCTEENDASSDTLNTSGISGIIRHPWYTAVILLLWSANLDYSTFIVNVIFSLYLVIGAFLEESKMVKAFGNQYIEYKREVSMFVPMKWIFKHMNER
jgi:protein-S-isoprenylcysteine O-methyltransferase Ste14